MKLGGGRAKGARFELDVAKAIREAFGTEKADVYRTPLSGGHYADRKHDPGDIQFAPWLRAALRLCIECKNHKGASLDPLLRDDFSRSYWEKWMRQASNASPSLIPCVVARVARVNIALLPYDGALDGVTPFMRIRRPGGDVWMLVPFAALMNHLSDAVVSGARRDS